MAKKEEIEKAIGAHGQWKARLKVGIDTGHLELPVETIQQDNQCAFGKWLHGPTLTSADRASEHYSRVLELHAHFHQSAARVATLALAGNKADATKMISLGGEYSAVSAKLTAAMVDWSESTGA